jgi:hypothetical protein
LPGGLTAKEYFVQQEKICIFANEFVRKKVAYDFCNFAAGNNKKE